MLKKHLVYVEEIAEDQFNFLMLMASLEDLHDHLMSRVIGKAKTVLKTTEVCSQAMKGSPVERYKT